MERIQQMVAEWLLYMWPEFFITFAMIVIVGVVITFAFDMKQRLDNDDADK